MTQAPKWVPKNNDERIAVMELCAASILCSIKHQQHSVSTIAERIVPDVPKPKPVFREVASIAAKGIIFRCVDGVVQAKSELVETWVNSLSVQMADFDIIADLKANPTRIPDVEEGCLGQFCSKGCCGPKSITPEAAVIALLVYSGWTDEVRYMNQDKSLFSSSQKCTGDVPVRVLIAPLQKK